MMMKKKTCEREREKTTRRLDYALLFFSKLVFFLCKRRNKDDHQKRREDIYVYVHCSDTLRFYHTTSTHYQELEDAPANDDPSLIRCSGKRRSKNG